MRKEFIFVFVFTLLPVFALAKLVEVEVREGDTLYNFADKYLKDLTLWPKIYEINKKTIKDPDRIFPGQIIKIPIEMLKEEVGDLTKLLRDVKIKKREGGDWQKGSINERLFPEDGIMTGDKSSARVDFLVGSNLKIHQNSLIYLKPTKKKTAVASLLGGGLNVVNAKIITPSAQVIPKAGSEYDISIDKDKTTKVSVRQGEVDVKAKGKTVTVMKGFRTLVKFNEVPQSPKMLPLSGEEAMEFKGVININFHLQVSEDKNFEETIKDGETSDLSMEYIKKDIRPGKYFYRVAIVDSDGFKGEFSQAREFVVKTRDTAVVGLTDFEVIDREEGIMRVSGFARNARRVVVNGYAATLDENGLFTTTIILSGGRRSITLTAFSEEGIVLRKYLRTEDGMWLPAR